MFDTHVLVAGVMLAAWLLGAAYVLIRERRLLRSPVVLLILGSWPLTGCVAYLYGEIYSFYGSSPVAVSWAGHVLLHSTGCGVLAVVMFMTTNRLPRTIKAKRPLLYRLAALSPWAIICGYVLATVVLLIGGDALTTEAGVDPSPAGLAYRSFLYLPGAFAGLVSFVAWTGAYRRFGPPHDASAAALKRRFLPLAFGGLAWALLYLDHYTVPVLAQVFEESALAVDPTHTIQAIMLPVFALMSGSYLLALVLPYRPSDVAEDMGAFSRYDLLTESLSFHISGHLGRRWRLRFRYSRATRLIQAICDDLHLSGRVASDASTTYALASIARTEGEEHTSLRAHNVVADATRLRELASLHQRFLAEGDGSPRKELALRNKYGRLAPDALTLLGSAAARHEVAGEDVALELAAVAAYDTGLIPTAGDTVPCGARTDLGSQHPVAPPNPITYREIHEAYLRNKTILDADARELDPAPQDGTRRLKGANDEVDNYRAMT